MAVKKSSMQGSKKTRPITKSGKVRAGSYHVLEKKEGKINSSKHTSRVGVGGFITDTKKGRHFITADRKTMLSTVNGRSRVVKK